MKIKLDENISVEAVILLRGAGHDVDTVAIEGLTGHTDEAVWAAAQDAGRFLVTQDLDFSDVRRFSPGTHCGLLVLRLREPGRLAQIAYLRGLLREHDIESWIGCNVVATDHRVRIRRPAGG